MISLGWDCNAKDIDKAVYFELLVRGKGKPLSLSHVHRGSKTYLKTYHGLDTSLEDTKSALKRLVKSGDAVDVGNNKWQLRMEFAEEEKRKAKKLSKELSVPLPEPELIRLAKKSGNSITDLLHQFSGFACAPNHRHRGCYSAAREYLKNFDSFDAFMAEGMKAKAQILEALSGV